jgi:hypothetical protein
MKRKGPALTLILALLFSAMVGSQLSLFAKANFLFPPSPPAIIITSPTNSGTYNVSTLSLEVTFETYKTAYESGGVSRLFAYALDGQNPESITITNSSVAINPGGDVFFEGSDSLANLTEGLHNLTVRVVFDYAATVYHKSTHTESESTVHFRIDTIPQNISILMSQNSTYLLTHVPLQFFIDEPASWMGYSLYGQENVTVTGNITLPSPSVGQHTLTLYAKDAYGNPVASGTITFTVADTSPILLVVVAVSATAIGVLVYYKKRKH